jgi:GDPmannose 4,6-dehydratase
LLTPKVVAQNEDTPFAPQSPYAIAKVAAHYFTQLYRKSYNLHASCGILFNHESERRGKQFVSRKITSYIGELLNPLYRTTENLFMHGDPRYAESEKRLQEEYLKKAPKLGLGNLTALRDWGHAEDYVYAMWLMLQQDSPDDYVIGTGETHTVEEFLIEAFGCVNLSYRDFVYQDPKFLRPADVNYLCADYSKAKAKLGWAPKINFKNLVRRMVEADRQNPLSFLAYPKSANSSIQAASQVRISDR